MNSFSFKLKKETEKEFSHIDVFFKDECIGYIIKDFDAFGNFPNLYSSVHHNWYFCPECDKNGTLNNIKMLPA